MIVNDIHGKQCNCVGFIFQPVYGSYMVFGLLVELPDDYDFTDVNLLECTDFVLLVENKSKEYAFGYYEALCGLLGTELYN